MRSSAIASIFVASILIMIKSFLLKETGSFGLEASLLDSILDVVASFINFFAIRQALKPASNDYRFGYGKAEALAGLAQSVIITLSALWLIQDRFQDFTSNKVITITHEAFYWLIAISCFTLLLITWQRFVLRHVNSLAVQADTMHFETDVYMDLGLIFNFLCIHFFNLYSIDLIFGLGALLFILYKTYPILKQSFDVLMDRELANDVRQKIINIVNENPHVKNLHQLRTRSQGQNDVIQFHIVLNPHLTLLKAHEITDDIESALLKEFPRAHILIHQDCFQDEIDEF
jgi:ferrous-iron efflux pump FieF